MTDAYQSSSVIGSILEKTGFIVKVVASHRFTADYNYLAHSDFVPNDMEGPIFGPDGAKKYTQGSSSSMSKRRSDAVLSA